MTGSRAFTSGDGSGRIIREVRSLRVLIALAAAAAGIGAAWIELTSKIVGDNAPTAAIALLVGWSYVACGLIAWRQRPTNPLGPVMLFIGFTWFATFLGAWQRALPFTIGFLFQDVHLAGVAFLFLSFPSGHLTRRLDRALFGVAVALTGLGFGSSGARLFRAKRWFGAIAQVARPDVSCGQP